MQFEQKHFTRLERAEIRTSFKFGCWRSISNHSSSVTATTRLTAIVTHRCVQNQWQISPASLCIVPRTNSIFAGEYDATASYA